MEPIIPTNLEKEEETIMQEILDIEGSQEEMGEEEKLQNMELEESKVDIKSIIQAHGEQEINKMQGSQIRQLYQELKKGEGKKGGQEIPTTSTISLGD